MADRRQLDSLSREELVQKAEASGSIGSQSMSLSIGGGAFVTLPVSYVIPQATPPDTYSLMCSVTDDRARSSIFVVSLQVITAPTGVLKIYNISQITGPGTRSPLAGERVVARGIVTGLRPNAGGSRGFYIQSRPADVDDDPNTSEGLLVFTGSATPPPCAVVGNFIEIEGTVVEAIGSEQQAEGRSWRNVRDQAGATGWVASELLAPE